MLILGIDTCCMAATTALMSDDRLVAQVVQNNKKTHSQNIMPMIDFMLSQAEVSAKDVDGFAVAVGPGSFTGVRIGVATIKALAHATGKPCIAVSTLKALANNVVPFEGIICPIMDARRGQVYNALFANLFFCYNICFGFGGVVLYRNNRCDVTKGKYEYQYVRKYCL